MDSHLVYARGFSNCEASWRFDPKPSLLDKVTEKIVWHRLQPGSSYFSLSRRFSRLVPPKLSSVRLIHLHWIAKWLDWSSLFSAVPPTTPIVLSLHDAAFFTGGCHQPDGCNRYRYSCGTCPKLRFAWSFDPSYTGFRIRKKNYQNRHLFVIPNSRWMASLAQQAALFCHAQIFQPIHPGIDTRVFKPLNRANCRDFLQLPHDRKILCAGGADWGDANKGFQLLLQALAELPPHVQKKAYVLAYGSGHLPPRIGQIPIRHLGYIASEHLLALIYSASDIYCTPSLMESFGMTAAEAMSCGLPVIAYATGGLSEIITPGQDGWLVSPLGSIQALATALNEAFSLSTDQLSVLSQNARATATSRFDLQDIAHRFLAAYDQILSHHIKT